MKLKLKESIRANGVQYLPPAVVDTDEIGITQADADWLVRRGTADVVVEAIEADEPVETDEQRQAREDAEAAAAVVAEPQPEASPAKTSTRKR